MVDEILKELWEIKDSIANMDENLCQRCGMCASLCPTEAIALEMR